MTPLPHQIAGAEFLAARRTALLADQPRVGKEQPVDSLVMTPTGPRRIGDLKSGDAICDIDGGWGEVLGVYSQGVKQAYKITFRDGSIAECGEEHLWTVYTNNRAKQIRRGETGYRTYSLKDMMRRGLVAGGKGKYRVPTHAPAQFARRTFLIAPYFMGALLGDGSLCGDGVLLTVADRDRDIYARILTGSPEISATERRTGENCFQVRFMTSLGPNLLLQEIRALGLSVRSHEKFIPPIYLLGSIEQRADLLRGLMDTDGYCGLSGDTSPIGIKRNAGGVCFDTKSERLAGDVAWLVRSLGGVAVVGRYDRLEKGVEFRVKIQVDNNPFLTPFKRDRWSRISRADARITRAIMSAKPSRMVEQVCIRVSSSSGLYLTNDFIPTHNTGAAIMAADKIGARTILVLTTASGRAVWRRAFRDWQAIERTIGVLGVDSRVSVDGVAIASYESLLTSKSDILYWARRWNLLILDEDHRICNYKAKRTQKVYGHLYADGSDSPGLVHYAERVWHLTGTPVPHDLGNMWARLRVSYPECLRRLPDVTSFPVFQDRYCVIVQKEVAPYKFVSVVVKGRNEAELRARIGDWMLRRTQKDVGIRPPSYSILPMIVGPADLRRADGDLRKEEILRAAANGDTKDLEMHMGPLRRLTGAIKARAIVPAVRDFFEDGKGKLVLAYWHREVGDILENEMGGLNLVRVDGSTSARDREQYEQRFRDEPVCTLFLAQIDAAGEAIDLSAADELWFVEQVFSPRAMYQMSCRIANVGKPKSVFVKVATLENSIDEMIQERLMALWSSINEVVR